jgi:hypothetical protein
MMKRFQNLALKRNFSRSRKLEEDVVCVGMSRTPIGKCGGKLSSIDAPHLGSLAIQAAINNANIGMLDKLFGFLGRQ